MKNVQIIMIVITFFGGAFAIATAFFNNDSSMQVAALSFGVTFLAITLAVQSTLTSNKDTAEIKESITEIKEEMSEMRKSVKKFDEHQKLQNERLNNIEGELKIYQKKLTSTNLLAILINRKKEKDEDYE